MACPSVFKDISINNESNVHIGHNITTQYHNSIGANLINNDHGRCLDALFLTDPCVDRRNIILARGDRSKGTCGWITSLESYETWIDQKESSLLWICGGPGKGKTYLSIFLAEKLANLEDIVLLEYYCDNMDQKRNRASAVVRGFMFGLLKQIPDLSQHLKQELVEATGQLRDDSFVALWSVFNKLIHKSGKPVICVLDGLDECDNISIDNIVGSIGNFFQQQHPTGLRLKIALASRPLPISNQSTLAMFPHISLDKSSGVEQRHTQSDVKIFVEAKFESHFPQSLDSENFHDFAQQYVWCFQTKAKLVEMAEGTFLWAGFAMEQLKDMSLVDMKNVEEALKGIPKGLNAMYDRILGQIKSAHQKQITSLLQWVVVAVQPMSLAELSVAISLEPGDHVFRHDRVMEDLINGCKGLLVVADQTVKLVHQSVKDYLLASDYSSTPHNLFRVDKQLAHANAARKCISYLHNGCLVNNPVVPVKVGPFAGYQLNPDREAAFPLLSYSIHYWPSHARLSEQNLFGKDIPFFSKNSQVREDWLEAIYSLTLFDKDARLRNFSLLDIAAHFDLPVLARQLMNASKQAIEKDLQKPLYLAARSGCETIVRILLENGADVNPKNSSPLGVAVIRGEVAVVRLLLEQGARADISSNNHTPLAEAIVGGNLDIIRLVLEGGADVNHEDSEFKTSLSHAAFDGQLDLARLLLDHGAWVDTRDEWGVTPLTYAAMGGHSDLAELLLEYEADLNAEGFDGKTPLMHVASTWHSDSVELLLEHGAEINAEDIDGKTPLMYAEGSGYQKSVEILIEKGATKNTKDKQGMTTQSQQNSTSSLAVIQCTEMLDTVILLHENGAAMDAIRKYRSASIKFGSLRADIDKEGRVVSEEELGTLMRKYMSTAEALFTERE